jgi:hypothetical protein
MNEYIFQVVMAKKWEGWGLWHCGEELIHGLVDKSEGKYRLEKPSGRR